MTDGRGPFGRGNGFPLHDGGALAQKPMPPGEPEAYAFRCPNCEQWIPVNRAQTDGLQAIHCPWCGYDAVRDLWNELRVGG